MAGSFIGVYGAYGICNARRLRACLSTRLFAPMNRKGANGRGRELTVASLPRERTQARRLHCANQGALRKGLRRAPSACWQDGGWEKRARTSCRSGSETFRRSTTAGVQGIRPICEDGRILGTPVIRSQHASLSRANIRLEFDRRRPMVGPYRMKSFKMTGIEEV